MRPWLTVALLFSGCASAPQLVHFAAQKDAPVQVVKIAPSGDNLLAYVIVNNNTGRYVQDFGVTWTVFRPANCTASGRPAPRIASVSRTSVQSYAEDRRWWMLSGRGGSRFIHRVLFTRSIEADSAGGMWRICHLLTKERTQTIL